MYDKEYFEQLQNRSAFQLRMRTFFFLPLRPYLKGVVLDLGCGIGEVAEHVQDRSQYCGVDVNPYCVNYLQQKSLSAKLGSAYEIPLDAATVDVVIFSHVLEHLDDPDRAMKEIFRVLKPEGVLIIIVPMIKGFRRDSTHRIFYDKNRLRALADENNYATISVTSFPPHLEFLGSLLYFFEYRLIAQKKALSQDSK